MSKNSDLKFVPNPDGNVDIVLPMTESTVGQIVSVEVEDHKGNINMEFVLDWYPTMKLDKNDEVIPDSIIIFRNSSFDKVKKFAQNIYTQ